MTSNTQLSEPNDTGLSEAAVSLLLGSDMYAERDTQSGHLLVRDEEGAVQFAITDQISVADLASMLRYAKRKYACGVADGKLEIQGAMRHLLGVHP